MKNSLQKFMQESLDTFSDSPEEIFGIIVGRILQGIYEIYSWLNFGKKNVCSNDSIAEYRKKTGENILRISWNMI